MTINDADGLLTLIERVMEQARLDARRGDVEAIAFLKITTGESPMTDTTKLQEAVEQAEAAFWRLAEEVDAATEAQKRAQNARDAALLKALRTRQADLPASLVTAAESVHAARLALWEAQANERAEVERQAKAEVERLQAERDALSERLTLAERHCTGLLAQALGGGQEIGKTQEHLNELAMFALTLETDERMTPAICAQMLGVDLFGPAFIRRHPSPPDPVALAGMSLQESAESGEAANREWAARNIRGRQPAMGAA